MARFLIPLFILSLVLPSSAFGHGEQSWITKYVNAFGTGCCHPTDTAEISQAEANAATIGTVIVADFVAGGVTPVAVNKIYQTEDKDGKAYITTYGCLFRNQGM